MSQPSPILHRPRLVLPLDGGQAAGRPERVHGWHITHHNAHGDKLRPFGPCLQARWPELGRAPILLTIMVTVMCGGGNGARQTINIIIIVAIITMFISTANIAIDIASDVAVDNDITITAVSATITIVVLLYVLIIIVECTI